MKTFTTFQAIEALNKNRNLKFSNVSCPAAILQIDALDNLICQNKFDWKEYNIQTDAQWELYRQEITWGLLLNHPETKFMPEHPLLEDIWFSGDGKVLLPYFLRTISQKFNGKDVADILKNTRFYT